MIESAEIAILPNREQAGLILAQKLKGFKEPNAIVVGIPNSGVAVAAAVAGYLSLPLEVIPCQRIKHPADESKNLGSVGLTEVFFLDGPGQIPQDFIAHQVNQIKRANGSINNFYHTTSRPLTFKYKTVIVVDDLLKSSCALMACLLEIKKQMPMKIVVAIPVVSVKAANEIKAEVDDLVFIKMERDIGTSRNYFSDWQRLDQSSARKLFDDSNRDKKVNEPSTYATDILSD